eukprot:GFUD01079045.1.p1 GENE.GFUD01079045.1~~GFUD01079045.1.p1  ORF type:complete len:102 (+),score=20.61 GFUD01079045.1:161-466(+)
MLSSCCCYDPETDSWTDVADMPDKFAYFSCLVVGKVVWVMGGMSQDYKCRTNTYMFNTVDGKWNVGPSLNTPRKGAFWFCSQREDISVWRIYGWYGLLGHY